MGLGLSALLGYLLDFPVLYTFGSAIATTKIPTALLMLLLGTIVLLHSLNQSKNRLLKTVLAGSLLGVSAVIVMSFLLPDNAGFGLWLKTNYLDYRESPWGRPALITALSFGLVGGAFLLIQRPRMLMAGQLVALFCLMLDAMALLGHMADIPAFYTFGSLSAVALPTVLGLLLSNFSVLWLTRRQGILQTLTSSYWGGMAFRYTGLYLFVVPALLLVGYLLSVSRQWIDPQFGLLLVLYLFTIGAFVLFYNLAGHLNKLDAQSRWQVDQLRANSEELIKQKTFTETIFNSVTSGIIAAKAIRSVDGQIEELMIDAVNQQGTAMTGHTVAAMLGQRLGALYPGIRETGLFDLYARTIETGEPQTQELYYGHDGLNMWVDLHTTKLGDGLVITWNDISERKQAELEVQKQASEYKAVLDTALTAILTFESVRDEAGKITDFRYLSVNQAMLRPTGLSESHFVGNNLVTLYPGMAESGILTRYISVVETGESQQFETHYQYDGYDMWNLVAVSPYGDGVVVSYVDITAQKQAELSARQQAELLESIQNTTQMGISAYKSIRDESGTIINFKPVFRNAASAQLSGEPVGMIDPLNDRTLLDLAPAVKETGLLATYIQVAETGESMQFEQHYTIGGTEKWYEMMLQPWGDGFVANVLDTTELRKTEREKLEQAEWLTSMQKVSQMGLSAYKAIRNEAGKVIDFQTIFRNEASARMSGQLLEGAIGKTLLEWLPSLRQSRTMEYYVGVLESGKAKHFEHYHEGEGISGWFEVSVQPWSDGLVVSSLETNELQKVEREKLEQAELLRHHAHQLELANYELKRSNESLQSFAFIASHDLQEPLRKITSFSDMLFHQFAGQFDPNATDLLRRMNGSALRMRQLIQDLLAYSRVETQHEAYRSVDLMKLIDELRENELWEAFYRSKAQLNCTELPLVKADPFQMRQLLQNLLSNAIKFTPTGTQPGISITSRQLNRAEVPAGLLLPIPETAPKAIPKRFYEISVRDNGIGFDQKHQERVFQIFQRLNNRSEYEGTGIGLAICKKIMERHNGAITVQSEPGKGSTFCVYLPCA